ncbi:MAG TPA: hypothetical protein PLE61_10580 [Vicinamibacterales bacterium]|nr:hypothetical protein [Vicinamibacterales bacterium]
MKPDGNVAFKVTWVYGRRGPFSTACTPEGRRLNIEVDKRTWCSQRQNRCNKLWRAGNRGRPYPVSESDYPCLDVMALRSWSFSAGYYHHGKRKDEPIPMRGVKVGKLAFLTTRRHDMSEADRIVIGCFRVSAVVDEDGHFRVEGQRTSERLRVRDFARAPRYWDYHRQTGGPRWGTGLFRYLPDAEAQRLFLAVRNAAGSRP